MIRQRAEALCALLDRRRTLGGNVEALEGYRARQEEIARIAGRIESLMATWDLFGSRNIGVLQVPPQTPVVRQRLEELRDNYSRDNSVVLGPNRLNAVRVDCDSWANSIQQQLEAAWTTFLKERVPDLDEQVLGVIGGIPVLQGRVAQVSTGIRELRDRARCLPTSVAELEEVVQKADTVRRIWTSFDGSHLPTEVVTFLRDASTIVGASLERLTPVVLQWLAENRVMGGFRIHMNAPASGGR